MTPHYLSAPFAGRTVCRRQRFQAFTLIELLVVMAIMALMLGMAGPAVTGILKGQYVTSGADTIAGLLEMARSEAIAKKTYVWVGIAEKDGQLQVAAIRSLDATGDLSDGNYAPVGNVRKIDNLKLAAQGDLGSLLAQKLTKVLDGGTSTDIGAAPSPLPSFKVGGQSFDNFIVFTSQGEVLTTTPTATTPFVPNILIGLQATRGGQTVAADANNAAILLNGGSGRHQVIRL